MPTYLLVWNVENWTWKTLDKDHGQFIENGYFEIEWCCGNQRSLQTGSRVFLVRQGKDPRGIMASGMIISDSYPAPCRNPLTECHEATVPTIDVKFDKLLNPNKERILSRDTLLTIPDSSKYWDFPISGTHMDSVVAGELEVLWEEFLVA